MLQPVDESTLPQPRIAAGGKTYLFPFVFVVPNSLLPSACSHGTANEIVKEAHLHLPPSIGDRETDSGSGLVEDFAPQLAKISYCINAKMIRVQEEDETKTAIAESSQTIRIIPVFEEQPPLDVNNRDEDYCLRSVKMIRKGLFKGRLGHVVVEATQPRSLNLSKAVYNGSGVTCMTTASLQLRFDPAEAKSSPPELVNLSSRLKITTYFASSPRPTFPSVSGALSDASQGFCSFMQSLVSRSVASAQWERHEAGSDSVEPDSRRGSAVSTATQTPAPSPSYTDKKPFYTTNIIVPISLPADKTFLPTFHSCLISRIYTLILTVALESSGTSHVIPVRVPLQISASSMYADENITCAGDDVNVVGQMNVEPEEVDRSSLVGRSLAREVTAQSAVSISAMIAPLPEYETYSSLHRVGSAGVFVRG